MQDIAVPLLSPVKEVPEFGAKDTATQYKVYPRRWYILLLMSLASAQQSCTWMTFSPIEKEVKNVYGWDNDTIFLLESWGPIIYLPIVLLSAPIVDRIGVRASITVAAASTFACHVLRSLTVQAPYALVLAHCAQICNALAGPFVLATPSKLSTAWFAPKERTLATSLTVMANYMGTGVGFLAALPVKSAPAVRRLLYAEGGFALFVLLLCVLDHVCFAAMPPTPPSTSASEQRTINMGADMLKLLRNPAFMLLAVTYGVSLGTYSGWSGVLDPILKPLHFSQATASWLGFASTVGAVIGGIGLGYIVGVKRVKLFLVLTYLLSFVLLLWFSLLADRVIAPEQVQLFVACTVASGALNAVNGIFYEAAVEACHPVDEVLAVSVITFIFNLVSGTYSVAGPHIPPAAMNYILTGCSGVSFIALAVGFKEHRRRIVLDDAAIRDDSGGGTPQDGECK